MKKKILICAFIIICLSVVAYGTAAFFTYEESATNVITMGNIKIELSDISVSEDGSASPSEDTIRIVPGTDVSKVIQIENVGDNPAWVRISVEKSIALAEGVSGDIDLSLIGLDINTQYWTEADGYYYYNTVLESGKTTEPLFTTVSFAAEMSNIYQQSIATIDITAYATQADNNGETVFDAAGWPTKD